MRKGKRMTSSDREMLENARTGKIFLQRRVNEIGSKREMISWDEIKRELRRVEIELSRELGNKALAELRTWTMFEDAALSGKSNKELSALTDPWLSEWSDHISPLMLEALMMAFDIGRGFTEKDAYSFHQEWLDADPENRIYGDYYFSAEGLVVKICIKREHLLCLN